IMAKGFIAQAQKRYDFGEQKFKNYPVLQNSGDIIQLPDGRAAVCKGLALNQEFAVGDGLSVETTGIFKVPLANNINILKGGKVYWQRGTSPVASFTPGLSGKGFYLGTAVEDVVAAASGNYAHVDLNVQPLYKCGTDTGGQWSSTIVKTSGAPAVTRDNA